MAAGSVTIIDNFLGTVIKRKIMAILCRRFARFWVSFVNLSMHIKTVRPKSVKLYVHVAGITEDRKAPTALMP